MTSKFTQRSCLVVLCTVLLSLAGCVTPRPRIAPPTGIYNCPETVTVTNAKSEAAIYYTTDGSLPTTSSTRYKGPFAVNSTDKVQAIAQAPGSKVSTVATVMYTCTPNLTVTSFADQVQQRFSLPQPTSPIHFADLAPGDPNYAAAQAIAPFLHRQVLCPGCVLSANFGTNQPLTRAASAVFFVSLLMAQNKVQLLSTNDAKGVLANVPDSNVLPELARRYVATAIKNGILSMREGNTIQSAMPLSSVEMTGILQTIQNQFNLPPAGPQ